MRRDHIYRLRLGDAERDDLNARAAAEGIAKADVIRDAMGWEREGLIQATPTAEPLPAAAVADPEPNGDGPGARAAAELARRIEERKAAGERT